MIKVLQFPIASSQGGYTQYVTNIWRLMNRDMLHFDFVTFSKTIDFAEELIRGGCKVYQISTYPEEDMKTFMEEFGKVLDSGYDIIEVHTSFWKNTIVEQMAKERNIKVIVHAHSTGISKARNAEEEKRLLKRHLDIKSKIDENLADYYFACSQDAAEWLYGDAIPEEKVKIIHNTIDANRFAFNEEVRQKMRKTLQLEDQFVIGHVGRLERVKNQQFLIEIFAEVHEQMESAVLLLIGDGSLRRGLEELAETLGVADSVIFMGKKREAELYYQAMDLFLLPSLMEGFPIVLLEAQCNGLRCLCSEEISPEVFVTDGIKKLPLSNHKQWIREIIKVSAIQEREDGSGIIMRRGFDTNKQIRIIEELYHDLI